MLKHQKGCKSSFVSFAFFRVKYILHLLCGEKVDIYCIVNLNLILANIHNIENTHCISRQVSQWSHLSMDFKFFNKLKSSFN